MASAVIYANDVINTKDVIYVKNVIYAGVVIYGSRLDHLGIGVVIKPRHIRSAALAVP